ncbi:MAG TPA: PfkB family carbohydrate kinase [Streptosporangiaceae bacterium]|jgi:1-phosphofructokinase|nr:PfkB family carbohydrate kinase [Streptosporangiaceae bacterium]
MATSARPGDDLSRDERAQRVAPRAMVFAPSPLLTVTVEQRPDGSPQTHLHAGGQGVWIARLLARLAVEVRLCGPFGGEIGAVLPTLVQREGIGICRSPSAADNGSYVHDRRSGERRVIASAPPPPLGRHQLDELFNMAVVEGLESDVAVLAGPDGEHVLPPDTYRRLASNLVTGGVPVVADLSGECLTAAVAGRATVLKVSHEDLIGDGRAQSDDPAELMRAMGALARDGATTVIVSRAAEPALVLADGRFAEVHMPVFEGADPRGAGDSMTGGLAADLARGTDLTQALRLGAAAGALNSTRHGLATGDREQIERLARRIEIRPLERDSVP